MFDIVVVFVEKFGWQITLVVMVIAGLVIAVRTLATRLEKAYLDQVTLLKEGHARELQEAREGCAREIAEVKVLNDRGWAMADRFKEQVDRLVDRQAETAQILRDLADDAYEQRGRRRQSSR